MVSGLAFTAALIRRDWRIALSYRGSYVLEVASMILFLAVFFYLGRLINEGQFQADEGLRGDYFAFAAVGISVLRIAQMSLSGFSRKLREEQTTGTFEALMSAPVRPALVALASAAYDLLRGAASGLVVLVAAVAIFGVELHADLGQVAVALVALIGCLGLFAALCVALGAMIVVLQRATALLGIALAVLALLGGVYFPADVLPQPLEAIAAALPFTWGLDVIRESLLGGDPSGTQLVGLYAAAAILLPLALAGFTAAVRHARQAGTVAAY
jgi:ABC-2 type transport system permease protein